MELAKLLAVKVGGKWCHCGLKLLNSGGIILSTCESLTAKLRSYVDDGRMQIESAPESNGD